MKIKCEFDNEAQKEIIEMLLRPIIAHSDLEYGIETLVIKYPAVENGANEY